MIFVCRKAVQSVVLLAVFWISLAPGAAQERRREMPLPLPAVPDALGVNIHFTDPQPGEMRQLADAGFRWIRMDFTWDAIEHEKGRYDFAPYDRLMAALKPYNIRPLFILDYGNHLYDKGSLRSPEARTAFAHFAAAGVRHFRGQGVLWEMWNEPNGAFWGPHTKSEGYVALAREVGRAIRAVAPEAYFIGPGMCTMDMEFLEQCCRGGLLEYWDAVSFHPYRGAAPETALQDFDAVRRMIARYAPRGRQIALINSEWGYSMLNPEKQGRDAVRMALTDIAGGLIVSIWYDWRDDGINPKDAEHHFGTLFNDYRPKSTYRAVRNLAHTLAGFRFNKRLALDSPDDYCLLFSRGTAVRLAVWTNAAQTHEVVLPTAVGKFTAVGLMGGRSRLNAGSNGLRVRLTDAPQYLIPNTADRSLILAAEWNTAPREIQADSSADVRRALRPLMNGSRQIGNLSRGATIELRAITSSDELISRAVGPFRPSAPLPAIAFRVDRVGPPVRLQAILRFGSLSLRQEVSVVTCSPLELHIMAPCGNTVPVRVENPTGRPFDGWVELRRSQGAARGRAAAVLPAQPVRLHAGETERLIRLTAPSGIFGQGSAQSLTLRCAVLADGTGASNRQVVGLTTPVRFVSWASFGRYPLGVAPPAEELMALPDGDPKVGSEIAASVVVPPAGLPAAVNRVVRIDYRFNPGWKFLRLEARGRLAAVLSGKPEALGMWMWSDGAGDTLHARFVDATGQTFQLNAGATDWHGWRYVAFSLVGANGGYWGGADDGEIHYPIHIDTPVLIDVGGRSRGTIYCTAPILVYPVSEGGGSKVSVR